MEYQSYKEIVLSSDASHTSWNCCAWDPRTGMTINTFKTGNSSSKGLALIGRDYVISAIKDKPLINVWTCRKTDRVEQKFTVPGVVSALCISPDGHYCVAGINKKLYTWEVVSGDLLSINEYHHQDVKCIKFTDEGFHFISGGKDALVLVWQLRDVLAECLASVRKPVKPLYTWCDHSSDVTDIHVGYGGMQARVATVSLDETCRVYNLSNGKLLFSVYVDVPLHSVVMDAAEYFLSLGTHKGTILQVKWYSCLQTDSTKLIEKEADDVFVGHSGPVTCLSSSMDGKLLLSGSNDGTAKVWDVISKLCLVTFKHHGPVTNAFFTMAPTSLLNAEVWKPRFAVQPFKRELVTNHFEGALETNLQTCLPTTFYLESCDDTFNEMASKGLSAVTAENKAELLQGIDTVLGVNQQLYSFSMNSFLSTMKDFKIFEQ